MGVLKLQVVTLDRNLVVQLLVSDIGEQPNFISSSGVCVNIRECNETSCWVGLDVETGCPIINIHPNTETTSKYIAIKSFNTNDERDEFKIKLFEGLCEFADVRGTRTWNVPKPIYPPADCACEVIVNIEGDHYTGVGYFRSDHTWDLATENADIAATISNPSVVVSWKPIKKPENRVMPNEPFVVWEF